MGYARYRPTVAEVMPLVNAFYAFPRNGVGGSLHIVLDDENIDDGHVDYCIEFAQEKADVKGELLGKLIRMMSKTQRGKLAAHHRGYEHGYEMDEGTFISACTALLETYQPQPA